MEKITVNNIDIDVVRKDIKNIHLAVYPPTGRVRIAVPLKVNDDAIRCFAITELGWIKRHVKQVESQERIPAREYKNRESHYFQGKRYLLNVIESDTSPRIIIRNKTYIDMHVKAALKTTDRHRIMNEWYRKQLKRQIPALIEKWEKTINVHVKEWQVKQMKTKWGSCIAEKGKILINLELAKKPEECLEYIIVHELVHLRERLHNDIFKNHMDTYLPSWRNVRNELNRLPVSHVEWKY